MLASTMFVAAGAFAQGPPAQSTMSNSLAITLVIVIAALALAIGLLANVVIGAAQVNLDRHKEAKQKQAGGTGSVFTILALCLLSTTLFAQDTAAAAPVAQTASNYSGLSATTFYMLVSIIVLELIVLVALVAQLKSLLAKDKPLAIAAEDEILPIAKASWWKNLWAKANSFRPIHEEHNYTLDHNYDGIQELDNSLPKWWLYGFYACIIFSFVYIYRFHISHSGPSSEQEYITEVAKADAAKEEYLKKGANKVDENTVVLITDAAALAEGKKLFTSNCAACHGPEGGGIVGPNLTDDYWLHKGGVKDIFKTIKYGVAEKGMKSWKDDFSPVQIAQITSYIKSIHGTKPANPKEPQGEIFTEENSATAPADTTKLAAK
jgi:cytochrome c oxidase cbb3-type subunit III